MESTNVMTIKELTKNYKAFMLGPLNLNVEKGTSVALVGANGSGKSMLFRLIMNILQPTEGSIEIFDQELTMENEVSLKEKLGFVGELLEPFSYLSIKELSTMISFWYPTWDDKTYHHLLERYQINEETKYGNCSKGMKKKVEFIFSLSHHPDLLLLDEPTAGIDISTQRKIKEDLMLFMESGEKSMIIATHMVDEINQLCDYITVLDRGKIIYTANKDEIYENWARLWVTGMTDSIRNHPNVFHFVEQPLQLITNNWQILEDEFRTEGITITHSQKVSLEEVIDLFQ
ncbi:ABC transporter [Halalkalibacter wakoensis JCM 9140]|uniref:ABC transporter n=1 Tax=Halalkalibacter wakoensis JCM 9140 TaxID=1236970 RepID=W4Q067_9BACI|nr:ABC transporter ATP-binding protein [Halalkalibacter wakoensis]GAE25340.1 ABC transporter [Halalkalibacter wakoensis JCM 9140]